MGYGVQGCMQGNLGRRSALAPRGCSGASRPLPLPWAHEAYRGNTIVLESMIVDAQIHPRPELTHLRAFEMVIIKKFPVAPQNDHGGDTIVPLAQIGRIAKDMDVIAQQAVFVEGHNLRDL